MCDKLPQEKLHLKFCKYPLGVNSKATNLAVRGETGRYPILLQILTNMFKYLIDLKTSQNDLLKGAYELSKELSNKGVDSWYCSTPQGSPGVGRNTFLSSPHLCFIIVFICDLFVSRDDPLMS